MSEEKINILNTIPVHCESIKTEWEGNTIVISFPRFKYDWMKRLFSFKNLSPDVHLSLEEHGTAVWQLIDGKRSVQEIINALDDHFSHEEEYAARVVTYIRQLHKDGFIRLCQL